MTFTTGGAPRSFIISGDYTLGNGASLTLCTWGFTYVPQSDTISVAGTTTIGSSSTLTVQKGDSEVELSEGDYNDLIHSVGGITGDFSSVNLPEPDEGEWSYGIVAGSGSAEILRIEVGSE